MMIYSNFKKLLYNKFLLWFCNFNWIPFFYFLLHWLTIYLITCPISFLFFFANLMLYMHHFHLIKLELLIFFGDYLSIFERSLVFFILLLVEYICYNLRFYWMQLMMNFKIDQLDSNIDLFFFVQKILISWYFFFWWNLISWYESRCVVIDTVSSFFFLVKIKYTFLFVCLFFMDVFGPLLLHSSLMAFGQPKVQLSRITKAQRTL